MPNLSDYNPAIKYGANLDVNVDLGDIRDANGNEAIEIDAVTSAVNYIRIANAATGGSPTFSAQGDDTNIDVVLTPKGTGVIIVGDSNTGTIASGSVLINAQRGVITTGALTTAPGTAEIIHLVNNKIVSGSQIFAIVQKVGATSTANVLAVAGAWSDIAGSAIIKLINPAAAGTVSTGAATINFVVLS